MLLYTFQHIDVLKSLHHSKDKIVLANFDFIKKEFLGNPTTEKELSTNSKIFDYTFNQAYKWISKKLNEKVPYPHSHVKEDYHYPFWAYSKVDCVTKSGRPDLRFKSYNEYINKYKAALITLDIPDDLVLLSDYDAWHWVLNKWYLGYEYQLKNFLKIYSKESGKKHCEWFEYEKLSDELKMIVEETWENVFNLKLIPKMLRFKKHRQVVQAVFWDIKLEYIKNVIVKMDNKLITINQDNLGIITKL